MTTKYELYKMDNGIKVLLIPDKSTYSVTISAMLKSPACLETEKTQGLTHFVEHLSILANKNYPNREDLSKIREFNGAYVNASTSKGLLKYYTNLPYFKLEFGIKDIFATLYQATYSDNLIEQERTTIVDEIKKGEDDPYQQQWQFLKKTLITPKNGYLYDIAGSEESVSNFTKEILFKHYKKAHKPNNLLLAIVGKFETKKTKKLLEKYFSNIENGHKEDLVVDPKVKLRTKVTAESKCNKTDLILTSLIIPVDITKKSTLKEIMIANVTSTILGGPMSSRLKNRLREKEGLLYHIQANTYTLQTYGMIDISFDTTPQNATKALNIVKEELKRFTDGVSKKELNHFKEYLKNRTLIRYDNIKAYSSVLIEFALTNKKFLSLEQFLDLSTELSLADINNFIEKYYKISDVNITRFGNV